MGVKPTNEQKDYLLNAEYEYSILNKPLAACPKCGKSLMIVQLGNGARVIRCTDGECLSYTIRGL